MTRPRRVVQWTGDPALSKSMGSGQRSFIEYANDTLAGYRVLVARQEDQRLKAEWTIVAKLK